MSEHVNHPEKKFRSRGISASIWPNETETKDGTKITKSIQVQKSYTDSSGEWKNHQITFFPDEIKDLQVVADEAFKYCRLKESDEQ